MYCNTMNQRKPDAERYREATGTYPEKLLQIRSTESETI